MTLYFQGEVVPKVGEVEDGGGEDVLAPNPRVYTAWAVTRERRRE